MGRRRERVGKGGGEVGAGVGEVVREGGGKESYFGHKV